MYDLIIKNASVLDGTGREAFASDIAIKDGKIAAIDNNLDGGEQTIDAAGMTVSPGWIDSHSHVYEYIDDCTSQWEKLEQGITLSVAGQCGNSGAPLLDPDGSLKTMGEYFDKLNQVRQGASVATHVGHNRLRRVVMGNDNRDPTAEELRKMRSLLREAMEAGALGLSLGLFYIPGCYAKREELLALAKVVASYKGILSAHIRDEGAGLVEAVEEFVSIAKEAGCRGVISHHKAMYKENWGKVNETLAIVDAANAQGGDIYMDVYPYCASATALRARFIPKQFHPSGQWDIMELLNDPAACKKITRWIHDTWGDDLNWVLIVSCPSHPEYVGKTINQIAQQRQNADVAETVLTVLRESKGGARACFFVISEEDLETVLRHPRSMVCTDSSVCGNADMFHPRATSSFPRVLGNYVRKKGVTTLPEMIRKMTSLPANVYGLQGKGRVCVGADADICIFDPEKITDRSDYLNCRAKNEGLHYVIIDGKVVLENGKANGVLAGKLHIRENAPL